MFTVPSVICAFFAGSLLDQYGCKLFIILPMIGEVLGASGLLINYIFIDTLPVEFFYIKNTMSFFGGVSVYYLGVYGYGTLKFDKDSRVLAMTRYHISIM